MKTVLKQDKTYCDGCPLNRSKGKQCHYVPTEVYYDRVGADGKPEVDVLVVGDAVGKAEDENCMPFTGQNGEELRNALKKIGIESSFALAHAVRCRPTDEAGNNRVPSLEELAACSHYVKQDLIQLKPKVVVLMGNTAKDSLAPTPEWKARSIGKLKGEIFVQNGITYTATVNPSMFLRSNNYNERERFHRHIGNVGRILTGEQSAYARKGVSTLLKTEKEANDFLDLLESFETEWCCVDTEAPNLNRVAPNKLATIQFAIDNEIGFVLPLEHWQSPWTPEFLEHLRQRLARIFTNPNLKIGAWIAHNAKFDYWQILRFCRIESIALPFMDTIFLEYLRDENTRRGMDDDDGSGSTGGGGGNAFDLKSMAKDKLGFYHYNSKILEARKGGTLVDEPLWNPDGTLSDFTIYAGMDVYVGRRLACYITNELGFTTHKDKSIQFARKWGSRVTHLLAKVEANGGFADKDQLAYLQSDDSPILTRMAEIPHEIMDSPEGKKANALILSRDPRTKGMKPLFGKAPIVFDINKKDHRIALLIDTCGLEPLAYGTKKGEKKSKYAKKGKNGEIDKGNGIPSINKAFFNEYKEHKLAALVQEYEGLKKLKSSYLNSVMSFLTDEVIYTKRGPKSNADNLWDKRIHATFWDSRTVTGRFASSDPNLQQLPRCTVSGTLLQTEQGLWRIEDLVASRFSGTVLDGGSVTGHFQYEDRETLVVTSKRGYKIEATPNHRIRVIDEQGCLVDKPLAEISTTDHMLIKLQGLFPDEEYTIPRPELDPTNWRINFDYTLPETCTADLARLLGYLLSEGWVADESRFSFTNSNKEIVEDYLRCFESCFGVSPEAKFSEKDSCFYVETGSVYLRKFLELCGLDYTLAPDKTVPKSILQSPRDIVLNFLAAFCSGDGSIGKNNVRFLTSSDRLAAEIQTILASLGYLSSNVRWKAKSAKKGYGYAVVVEGQSAASLLKELPIAVSGNKEKFDFSEKRYRRHTPKVPHAKSFLRESLHESRASASTYIDRSGRPTRVGYVPLYESPAKTFSYQDIAEYPSILRALDVLAPERSEAIRILLSGKYVALPVRAVTKGRRQTVYDIETETHYYVANGISSHNSDNFAKGMIKSMYGAAPGHVMLEADFGQAEIRWWAQIAKDQEFAKLFNDMVEILEEFERNPTPELAKRVENECDIHKQVSAAMNRIPIEQVTKEMRQDAKGLCVAPGTLIRTPEGLLPIETVIENWQGTATLETRNGVEQANRAFQITVGKTQKIKTSHGYTIHGRPEHPILVWRSCKLEFVELQNLLPDDRVVIRRKAKLWPSQLLALKPYVWVRNGQTGYEPYPCAMPTALTPDLARLVGYLSSEGDTTNEDNISVCNTDNRIIDDIRSILLTNFGDTAFSEAVSRVHSEFERTVTFTLNARASRFLRLNKLVGIETAATKTVPEAIRRSPREVVVEYLRGYLAGDASSSFRRVKACTASKRLAKEIQILLMDLGVVTKREGSYRVTNKGAGFYWDITATGKEAERCWEVLPPIRPLDEACDKEYNNAQLDHIWGLQEQVKAFSNTNYREAGGGQGSRAWKYPGFPWTNAAQWTVDFCNRHKSQILTGLRARDEQLATDVEEILTHGYFLDTIEENEIIEQKDQVVYDFTVPGSHSFVSNCLISHNSFGSLYGMSPKSLAVLVKCTEEQAKILIQTFTNKFERAGGWLEYIENFALDNGYVISPYGRVRHLGPLIEMNESAARRVARNSPIQGAASDTTAMAAWLIQDWIERNNRPYKIWNVVHDAISAEVPLNKESLLEIMAVMKDCMTKRINSFLLEEFGIKMIVPLVIDFKVGLRWGHCEQVDPMTNIDEFVAKLQEQDRRLHNGDKWWQIATEMEIKKLQKKMDKAEKEKKDGWEKEVAKAMKLITEHQNSLAKAR